MRLLQRGVLDEAQLGEGGGRIASGRVERPLHRDLVDLDDRPPRPRPISLKASPRFRPPCTFPVTGNEELIVFEQDIDQPHEGAIVTAKAFALAIAATDPPRASCCGAAFPACCA